MAIWKDKYLWLTVLLGFATLWGGKIKAQEIQAQVTVSAPQVGSDQQVYTQMQDAISQYINLRKWTELKFEPYERIQARIQILINDRPSVDYFKGTIQVQVIRPVYNSTYESLLVNIQDKDFNVRFTPFQPLEFNENGFVDNLTSILNFYAYMIIAFDMDSFEQGAGIPFFEKAQNYVNLSQNSGEPGWRVQDGIKTRYWSCNNALDNSFRSIHNIYYNYHRQGLDLMEKELDKARTNVLNSLKELQRLNVKYPGKYIVRIFLEAKKQEIVNIFSNALVTDKRQLITVMESLDPANLDDYQKVMAEGNK